MMNDAHSLEVGSAIATAHSAIDGIDGGGVVSDDQFVVSRLRNRPVVHRLKDVTGGAKMLVEYGSHWPTGYANDRRLISR
jgi:hypothetical protein